MIACGLRHEPGTLARSLVALAERGLSVTKIEGRPIRGKPFEYRFVVEVVAHDGRTLDLSLFEPLAAQTQWMRVLGIYDPSQPDAAPQAVV
jgi:chorismate mutase / prephenate dehydratase